MTTNLQTLTGIHNIRANEIARLIFKCYDPTFHGVWFGMTWNRFIYGERLLFGKDSCSSFEMSDLGRVTTS